VRVNVDFSRQVVVTPRDYQWVPSPTEGVERVMLDRIGAESGWATSIVRYAPGSSFPHHAHPGGEEILILSGTFSDGGQDHPAGCYLRNPPGSSHAPSSREGTTIFVKLWQMRRGESRHVRIDSGAPACWQRQSGRDVCPLYADRAETVSLQRLQPEDALLDDGTVEGGAEVLVLRGAVLADGQLCDAGSWIRLPPRARPVIAAAGQGVTLYLKTGHLAGLLQASST
jgi:anti-sigma factor ChrR (cupin superfamily)